jgi:hypothetical protein
VLLLTQEWQQLLTMSLSTLVGNLAELATTGGPGGCGGGRTDIPSSAYRKLLELWIAWAVIHHNRRGFGRVSWWLDGRVAAVGLPGDTVDRSGTLVS